MDIKDDDAAILPEPTLKLSSNDNVVVEIDQKTACQSKVLATMLRDARGDYDQEPLPLNTIKGQTLLKVMEWCEEHKHMTFVKKKRDEDKRIPLSQDDYDFLDCIDGDELLEIMMAANFLDIQGLIDITTQYVANMVAGKSVEEIREILCIENDLTREEQRKLAEQFLWAEAADA